MPVTAVLRANNASQDSSGSYSWSDPVGAITENFFFAICYLATIGTSNVLYVSDFAGAAAAIPVGSTINSLKIRAINIGMEFTASDIEMDWVYWMLSGVPIVGYPAPNVLTDSPRNIEVTVTTGLPTRSQIVSPNFGIGISVADYAWDAGNEIYVDELSLQVGYTLPGSAISRFIGGEVGRGIIL